MGQPVLLSSGKGQNEKPRRSDGQDLPIEHSLKEPGTRKQCNQAGTEFHDSTLIEPGSTQTVSQRKENTDDGELPRFDSEVKSDEGCEQCPGGKTQLRQD